MKDTIFYLFVMIAATLYYIFIADEPKDDPDFYFLEDCPVDFDK